jgi:uncharacterized membrane protein
MQHETESYESRLRSILKAVTYRIIGTLTTFGITFAVTGEIVTAIAIGGVEPVVKMIVYYFHERAWQCVPHGAIRQLGHSLASKFGRADKVRP